ncbi:MAG: DNA-directed RNA polymerase subunit omega, partial [Armatimonadetes bacterium]|nr:DNA-directed RNA polymerase subunit omega [Armatimonadota bacterium]
MIFPSMDKLENWGNRYALATLAAKRAKQIKSGAPPLVETDSKNPLTIALDEIATGKITCVIPE